MKRLMLCFTLAFFVNGLVAQTTAKQEQAKPDDVLLLKEGSFNFGRIPQGKPVTHVFEVVNTGRESLTIESVQASCGCTSPEWKNDPIPPGGSSKITVGYNAAAEGDFEKTITVFYKNGKMKTILIKGSVWKAPDQSAPLNNSITLLKNLN